jgi:hypothetical protein
MDVSSSLADRAFAEVAVDIGHNEGESGSGITLVEEVLTKLGLPKYGMKKFTDVLRTNHISSIEQLRALDNTDWKRLDLPEVIEQAVRKQLQSLPNQGRGSSSSSSNASKVTGLSLKGAKKAAPSKSSSSSGMTAAPKRPSLSVAAMEDSTDNDGEGLDVDIDDPFAPSLSRSTLPTTTTTAAKKNNTTSSSNVVPTLTAPPDDDTAPSTRAGGGAAKKPAAAAARVVVRSAKKASPLKAEASPTTTPAMTSTSSGMDEWPDLELSSTPAAPVAAAKPKTDR